MNERTEDEIYRMADQALAHLHKIKERPESVENHGPVIERRLELIRRRTDPAVRD